MYKKRKKKFKTITCFLLVLISLFFISCFNLNEVEIETTSSNDDEILISTKIPTTLKSKNNKSIREQDLEVALFEGLVEINESGKVIPSLCKGWRISTDGINYEFLLRDDITWSDGEKIKASDFVEFFKLLFSNNDDFNCEELYSIYGLENYKKGTADFQSVAIEAKEENILNIRLNKKDDDFLKKLAKPEYRLRKLNEPLDSYKKEFSTISYSGAYIIEKIEDDGSITLTENKDYILERNNKSNIRLVEEGEIEKDFAEYTVGKLDIIQNPMISAFQEGNLISNTTSSKSNNLTFMAINSTVGITKYLDFRKGIYTALSHSINNSYLLENNLARRDFKEITAEEVENNKIIPSNNEIVTNEEMIKKAEESSRNFFNVIPTDEKKQLTVIGLNNSENKILTEFIKEELKKYDIEVKIELVLEDELKMAVEKNKYNIYVGSVNLEEENLMEILKPLNLVYESGYNLFSLYRKYNLTCKSNKIKSLNLDYNGNLIFKNIII